MPKVVNKRFRAAARKAADPLNVVDEKQQVFTPSEHIHLNNLTENDLFHTIKERLKSSMPSERCVGTDMVSTFVTDKRFANFKVEQVDELFKILGALLLDRAENVRYGSVDALCYLSTLSDDICSRIVNNNVIRSLLLMLQTYFTAIDFQEPKVTDRKLTLNLYTDTFNILSYCAESSSKCLKELLANQNLQNIFSKALSAGQIVVVETNKNNEKKFDFTPIAIAASECLTVLVEDSQLFHKLLIEKQNGDEENILSSRIQKMVDLEITENMLLENSYLVYLHILAIFMGSTAKREIPEIPKEVTDKLFEKLSRIIGLIMSFDLTPQLATLLEKIQSHGSSSTFAELQEMNTLKNFANNIFKSKRCIFVLLTNILSFEDSDNEFAEEMMMDEDDNFEDSENGDAAQDDIQMDSVIQCDTFIANFLQQNQISEILQTELDKFLSIPKETVQVLNSQVYGQELWQCIENWVISILSLFNNLIQLKQVENLDSVGSSVSKILFSAPNTISAEIVEESSNVFREILQNNSDSAVLSIEQLQSLEQCFGTSQRFQLNFIKICSLIASSMISKRNSQPKETVMKHVELITSVLMRLYEQFAGDLVLKAEILDSLIDVYSDDNEISLDSMRKLNLLQFLQKNEKLFKTEVKCQRQLCKDNAVVDTVALNLRRFINYKQKLC